MQALADSGCQACCMGIRQMHAIGLQKSDLIQPRISLKAANITGISSKQLCYVTKGQDNLLLYLGCCQSLGLLPENFPVVLLCPLAIGEDSVAQA